MSGNVQVCARRARTGHKLHQPHRGDPVRVGKYQHQLFLGGTMYFAPEDLEGYDLVIPFKEQLSQVITDMVPEEKIWHYPIRDFSVPDPDDWVLFIARVADELKQGRRILAFCAGGHGRTGTFLASLIAVLEPRIKDPVGVARGRYCGHAVETHEQIKAVFALKGVLLPVKYQ
ncbi:MAG: hypothetical protein Q7R73_00325 [bacterium]|nr:hypothetical protein [bacterium]